MSNENSFKYLRISPRRMSTNMQEAYFIANQAMKLIETFGKGKIVIEICEADAMCRLRKYENLPEYKSIIVDEYIENDKFRDAKEALEKIK